MMQARLRAERSASSRYHVPQRRERQGEHHSIGGDLLRGVDEPETVAAAARPTERLQRGSEFDRAPGKRRFQRLRDQVVPAADVHPLGDGVDDVEHRRFVSIASVLGIRGLRELHEEERDQEERRELVGRSSATLRDPGGDGPAEG